MTSAATNTTIHHQDAFPPIAFALLAFAGAFAVGPSVGCRERPTRPVPESAAPGVSELPDAIPMFTTGALTKDPAFARRTYARGAARVTVTLARYPMTVTASQYDEWVQMSTAGYPQAALDVPPGSGNGFYECTTEPSPKCNLLIQLRAGVHIEIRGDGTAPRADIDAVARGLHCARSPRGRHPSWRGDGGGELARRRRRAMVYALRQSC